MRRVTVAQPVGVQFQIGKFPPLTYYKSDCLTRQVCTSSLPFEDEVRWRAAPQRLEQSHCVGAVGVTALAQKLSQQQLVTPDAVSSCGVVIELRDKASALWRSMPANTAGRFVVSRIFTLSRNDRDACVGGI